MHTQAHTSWNKGSTGGRKETEILSLPIRMVNISSNIWINSITRALDWCPDCSVNGQHLSLSELGGFPGTFHLSDDESFQIKLHSKHHAGCCYLSHSLSRIAINSVSHMACHEVTLCCYKHCKDTVSQSSLADMISHSFDVYQLKNIFITFSISIMKCLFWSISVPVLSTFSILYQDWINRRSIFSTWKRDINDL